MSNRPDGITCKDWEPTPAGGKRCRYFLTGGACERPTRLVCEEWAKVNPHLARIEGSIVRIAPGAPTPAPSALALLVPPPEVRRAPSPLPDAGMPLRLVPTDPAPRARAGGTAAEAARRAFVAAFPQAAVVVQDAPPFNPAKEIPPSALEALEAAGAEFVFEVGDGVTPDGIPLALVKARSGRHPERFELTFREAATLRLIVDAFPGARLVKLVKAEEEREAAHDERESAHDERAPVPGPKARQQGADQKGAAMVAGPSEPDPFEV